MKLVKLVYVLDVLALGVEGYESVQLKNICISVNNCSKMQENFSARVYDFVRL